MTDTLQFSPSFYHRDLAARTQQTMRYSGGDVVSWQGSLRGKLRELLGYRDEVAPRVSLEVRTLWQREHPLGRIEKIVFRAEPGVDVPAYVCLPGNAKPPYTFFICLQGHTSGMHNSIAVTYEDESKTMEVDGDRDFGLGCMARGGVVPGAAFVRRTPRVHPAAIARLSLSPSVDERADARHDDALRRRPAVAGACGHAVLLLQHLPGVNPVHVPLRLQLRAWPLAGRRNG